MASLKGQLLIASTDLFDPNFRRSVVLVTEHSAEGALGLVLNRPSDVTVDDAVPPLASLAAGDDPVYVGGPVEAGAAIALAEFDAPEEAAAIIFADVGFVPADADFAALAGSVRRARVFAGYAGWGEGQLEAELARDDWLVEAALPDDVFGDHDDLWATVVRRKGGGFALIATMPDDPSLN